MPRMQAFNFGEVWRVTNLLRKNERQQHRTEGLGQEDENDACADFYGVP